MSGARGMGGAAGDGIAGATGADPIRADWIAADWGASRLRVWAMDDAGAARAARAGDEGMGRLAPEDFEAALLRLVDDWLTPGRATPVVICGMVGSREGWAQAPYCALDRPLAAIAAAAVRAPASDPRLAVRILPGLRQTGEPDVMRGEETQLAGLLRAAPDFAGLVCLPGTHSKWAWVAGGRTAWFHTYMTGELFAAISSATVLRHNTGGRDWSDAAFAQAVAAAAAAPARWSRRLFAIRAANLIGDLSPSAARATLSGLLIGLELADALDGRADAGGGEVTLIGDGALSRLYARALTVLGRESRVEDAAALTLDGLRSAHDLLRENFDASS